MGHLITLLSGKGNRFTDSFDRLDNISTLGQQWNVLGGTWGISTNRAYSVTDTNGDKVAVDIGSGNFNLTCIANGQTVGTTNQRLMNILFRGLNSLNFLMVRISNGGLQIYKSVSGTLTAIVSTPFTETDNTDYEIRVNCVGNNIKVFVDGVNKIDYSLSGGDTVFTGYTLVGMRLTKVGSPTGTARVDNFIAEAI